MRHLTDAKKDRAVALAQSIAKYAFNLAFFLAFPRSDTQVDHCLANLKSAVDDLVKLTAEAKNENDGL
jgi:hypothetical protein